MMPILMSSYKCDDHEFEALTLKSTVCRICKNRYVAAYNRHLQAAIRKKLNEYKLLAGCNICGYNEHYAALQFDHIIPEELGIRRRKKRTQLPQTFIGAERFLSDPNIQVLCANCHCIKTRENKDYMARSALNA